VCVRERKTERKREKEREREREREREKEKEREKECGSMSVCTKERYTKTRMHLQSPVG